ncbi:MAG: hypothetical protein RMJ44_02635 [Cytophagales bacterium]|nr:hypothetical protein [Bernardetiaceae bacterium]MDW8209959.1 hypothetical protein [Cytophagales bacterium]
MLRLGAILCALIVLNQSFSRVWVWLSFQLNRQYIAQYLCEYKDRPEMRCGGKCYLAKQMAKAQKHEANIPKLKNHFDVTFFPSPDKFGLELFVFLPLHNDLFFIPLQIGVERTHKCEIEHPPRRS